MQSLTPQTPIRSWAVMSRLDGGQRWEIEHAKNASVTTLAELAAWGRPKQGQWRGFGATKLAQWTAILHEAGLEWQGMAPVYPRGNPMYCNVTPLTEIDRLRAEVAQLDAARDALKAELERLEYALSHALMRMDGAWVTTGDATREIERLRAEVAALNADLVVMWARREAMLIDLEEKTSERDEARQNADAMLKTIMEANSIIKTRTAERDEARREICDRIAAYAQSMNAKQFAKERGWDCFEKEDV